VADVKLELEDDFNELEGTVWVVGKVRVEEKAKLKGRLLRAQALLERPLKAFANCVTVRYEVGSIRNMYRTARICGKQLLAGQYSRVSTTFFNHAFITTLTTLSRDRCC
jgi:hypothetical protein